MLSVGITLGSHGPLLAPISNTFQLRLGQIALPIVSHSVGFLAANILMALFWRVRRARLLLTLSGLLAFLMLVGISLFCSVGLFLTFLFFLGVAQGTMHTSVDSLFSEISGRGRAKFLNWLHIFIGIGAVLGPLSVGILLSYSEKWHLVYLMMAMVTLPLPLFFFRRSLYKSIIYHEELQTPTSDSLAQPTTSPLFWLAIIGIFIYVGLELSFASWVPVFLVKVKNMSHTSASYSISIFWFALMTGRFLFGRFLYRSNLSLFLGVGALVGALFTTLIFCTDSVLIGLFMVFSGLSLSWFYPSILALGGNTFSRNIGFITASLTAGGTMGAIVFPWVIGPISETFGLAKGIFLLPLLCLALTGIFFSYNYLLKRKRKHKKAII
jgi:FHS family glucose/mannose:H+ symporter-like MFS transporter